MDSTDLHDEDWSSSDAETTSQSEIESGESREAVFCGRKDLV